VLVAEDHLVRAQEHPPRSPEWRRELRAVLTVLGAYARGSDPRLRLLLAEVLTDLGGGWAHETRGLLEPLLARAPDSDWAATGWHLLGLAAARLGDRQLECAAYDRALELVWDPEQRANVYYNRADAKMGLGRLGEAMVDYQEAIQLSSDPDTQALAYYGLGITLERRGDLPGALAAMRVASALRPPAQSGSALDKPSVFFVPAYDLYYYKALERMAAAEHAADRAERTAELESAIALWDRYLLEAEPDQHRWVQNARLNRANCQRAIDERQRPPTRVR
jgi:tetratricopeptide (TPR) repeat protein